MLLQSFLFLSPVWCFFFLFDTLFGMIRVTLCHIRLNFRFDGSSINQCATRTKTITVAAATQHRLQRYHVASVWRLFLTAECNSASSLSQYIVLHVSRKPVDVEHRWIFWLHYVRADVAVIRRWWSVCAFVFLGTVAGEMRQHRAWCLRWDICRWIRANINSSNPSSFECDRRLELYSQLEHQILRPRRTPVRMRKKVRDWERAWVKLSAPFSAKPLWI